MALRGQLEPIDPYQAWRTAQALAEKQADLQAKTQLAAEAGAISPSEVHSDGGFWKGVGSVAMPILDVLQRSNFALAGFADEMINGSGNPLSAIGRSATELLSGVGGLQGEKATFRDVLDGAGWFNATELRDVVSGVDDIPVLGGLLGSFNVRGTIGLALDIGTDPLTYLSLGGSALAKVPKLGQFRKLVQGGVPRMIPVLEGATEVFTRAGSREIAEQTAATLARANGIADFSADIANPLFKEADRIAVEEVQIKLMRGLTEAGITSASAADLANNLTKGVAKLRNASPEKLAAWDDIVDETLKGVTGKTRTALASVLQATSTQRAALNDALFRNIREAVSRVAEGGLDKRLEVFAYDLAKRKAMNAVIEAGKFTQKRRGIWFNFPGMDPWRPVVANNLVEGIVKSTIDAPAVRALFKRVKDVRLVHYAIDTAARAKPMYDMLGRGFHTGWNGRKLSGFNTLREANLTATAAMNARFARETAESPLGQWARGVRELGREESEPIFREFARAVEHRDPTLLPAGAMDAYLHFVEQGQTMGLIEVQRGLLRASRVHKGYFPHFFRDSDGRVQEVAEVFTGRSRVDDATIGRHAEVRAFKTLDEVDRAVAETGKKITPVLDPEDVLVRRAHAHIEGTLAQEFQQATRDEFGKLVEFNIHDLRALTQPVIGATTHAEAYRMASMFAGQRRGATKEQMRRMYATHGEGAVREYLRQRMLQVTSRGQLQGFLKKYKDWAQYLPAAKRVFTDTAADGTPWIVVPGIKSWEGYVVPTSVSDALKASMQRTKVPDQLKFLLDSFDTVNNLFKTTVTALFPAFHFRNWYGNVAQNYLEIGVAALDPRMHVRAAHLMASLHPPEGVTGKLKARVLKTFPSEDIVRTDIGEKLSMNQLQQELIDRNIIRSADEVFERTRREGAGVFDAENMFGKNRLSRAWLKWGRNRGEAIENEARILLYVTKRLRGFSSFEAEAAVSKVLFDYSSLTPFEAGFLKRMVPFYVWTSKNVKLQARMLADRPGRVLNTARAFGRVDPDVSESFLEYESEDARTAIQISRDGKTVGVLRGIDLPIHAIDRVLPWGDENFAKQLWNMVTPVFKTPAELAFGQSLYTGQSLDRSRSQALGRLLEHPKVPQSIRSWVGWQKQTTPSGKVNYTMNQSRFGMLLKSVVYSRLLSSSNQAFDAMLKDDNVLVGLASAIPTFLTAIRTEDRNLDQKALNKAYERVRAVEDRLISKGIGKNFERFYVPSNEPGREQIITDPRLPADKQPGIGIGRKR